jgi:hypothetical protein
LDGLEAEEVIESHMGKYRLFLVTKCFSLFKKIWWPPKTEKVTWRKRTKRCVVRYLIDVQKGGKHAFLKLPKAIIQWMEEKGTMSMYPPDGNKPSTRTTMTDWERLNCPWYLEFPDWSEFVSDQERAASTELDDEKTPENWYDISSLPLLADALDSAKSIELVFPKGDYQYDGKKTRMPIEKKRDLPAELNPDSPNSNEGGPTQTRAPAAKAAGEMATPKPTRNRPGVAIPTQSKFCFR